MEKKYGLLVFISIFLLSAIIFFITDYFYPFKFIDDLIFKREFNINPEVEVEKGKEYEISFWYYPFYRTIPLQDYNKDKFRKDINLLVAKEFPDIKIVYKELNFQEGEDILKRSLENNSPPDIYMNIGIDDIFNTELQIPVDNYIDKDLRKGFYSVDWWKIDRNTHLWGLPLLIYKQVWFSNKGIIKILNEKLINNLPSKTLALNYYSDLLPRQLLTLFNVKRLYIDDKGYLSANSLYQLEDFFNWLDMLRNKGVFVNDMTANFMKVYFSISDKIIGPVNPWLHYFLIKKSEGSPVYLLDTYQYIMLNIFKQKQYKGDDHTKAVMKVALLISRKYGQKMAEIMKTKAAYNPAINNVNNMTHIFKNSKEMNLYWEEIFMPLWIKFWEEELSPKEMISEFKSRNK